MDLWPMTKHASPFRTWACIVVAQPCALTPSHPLPLPVRSGGATDHKPGMPMQQVETSLSKLVMDYLVAEYKGSGDIEVFDTLDICDIFAKTYPETDGRNNIKARILELQMFAERVAPRWNAPSCITHVVAPDATTNPRFILAPWQVGLSEDHSIKGKSYMCYIFDTAHRVLLETYSSRKDPIHVLFSPTAVTGQEVPNWSMAIDVGMCNFTAVRMIMESLVTLRQRGAVSEAAIVE